MSMGQSDRKQTANALFERLDRVIANAKKEQAWLESPNPDDEFRCGTPLLSMLEEWDDLAVQLRGLVQEDYYLHLLRKINPEERK